MKRTASNKLWWIFAGLCIIIGLYPLIYFIIDPHFGLLSTKTKELLSDQIWNFAFYTHIIIGGVALLIGWTQFSSKLRKTRMELHRTIGKVYMISVLMSGTCGVYIAQFATGGLSNVIGFSMSGVVWLSTTILAFLAIRKGNVESHQKFMIYSYAVCFSAVTLRFWLPLLVYTTGEFNTAYLIVGWLSWVPNLIVAYYLINKTNSVVAISR